MDFDTSILTNYTEYNNFYTYMLQKFGDFIIDTYTIDKDNILIIKSKICSESCIIQKNPLKLISKFYTPDINVQKDITENWSKVIVTHIYHGTYIILFNIDNEWYEVYDNNISKTEILRKYICVDTLKTEYAYHFLINENQTNIILKYLNRYKLLLLRTVDGTKIINYNMNVMVPEKVNFASYQEMKKYLMHISEKDKRNKYLTLEGYCIEYDGKIYYEYTDLYSYLKNKISNWNNILELYLELYRNNRLQHIIPFVSKYSSNIIYRINTSMRTLSKEILNIYHTTRNKKNKDVYDILPSIYKHILYNLHGIYITSKSDTNKKDKLNYDDINFEFDLDDDSSSSITVYDVYNYIKQLPLHNIIDIYKSRQVLINNENTKKYTFYDCIYTLTMMNLL